MSGVATAVVAGNLISGSMQSDATYDAAKTQADAQLQAAQMSADAAKFRPVGITNTFGTSNFGFDPRTGYLNSAGYTLSPELQKYQNQLGGMTAGALSDATTLTNLGRSYINEDPNAVRQRYIEQQQALVNPINEQNLAGIRNNLFQRGRSGLSTGATTAGGLAATNPEMAAYYNSLANQTNQIAAGADQAAQQQINYGTGLLSSAYSPFSTSLGLQGTVEQLGQSPFTLSANLGGQQLQGGGTAAQALLAGGTNAANSMFKANSQSPLASTINGTVNNQQLMNRLFSNNNNNTGQNPNWYNNGGYDSWSANQNNSYDVGNMS